MFAQPFSLSHKSWIKSVTFTDSGRLVYSFWFIGVAFFYFFYSSTLRATLLTISYTKPVDTLKGTVKLKRFQPQKICLCRGLGPQLTPVLFWRHFYRSNAEAQSKLWVEGNLFESDQKQMVLSTDSKNESIALIFYQLTFSLRVSRTFWSTESWKRITFCKLWTGSSTSSRLISTRKRANSRSG